MRGVHLVGWPAQSRNTPAVVEEQPSRNKKTKNLKMPSGCPVKKPKASRKSNASVKKQASQSKWVDLVVPSSRPIQEPFASKEPKTARPEMEEPCARPESARPETEEPVLEHPFHLWADAAPMEEPPPKRARVASDMAAHTSWLQVKWSSGPRWVQSRGAPASCTRWMEKVARIDNYPGGNVIATNAKMIDVRTVHLC